MTTNNRALDNWLETVKDLTRLPEEDRALELRELGLWDVHQRQTYMTDQEFGVAYEEFVLAEEAFAGMSTKPQYRPVGGSYARPEPFSMPRFVRITTRRNAARVALRALCESRGIPDATI